jgi:hypothetical protein
MSAAASSTTSLGEDPAAAAAAADEARRQSGAAAGTSAAAVAEGSPAAEAAPRKRGAEQVEAGEECHQCPHAVSDSDAAGVTHVAVGVVWLGWSGAAAVAVHAVCCCWLWSAWHPICLPHGIAAAPMALLLHQAVACLHHNWPDPMLPSLSTPHP